MMTQIKTGQRWHHALRKALQVMCFLVVSPMLSSNAASQERPLLTLDENVWATFYDLPSRRFRNIRDAFVRKDFDTAQNDLQVAINFTSVEAARAPEMLQAPMTSAIAALEKVRANIRTTSISGSDLDSAFSRVHWLLAQHYLLLAIDSRDTQQHKNAGRYLWATAHHLERAVLWSDARVDRAVINALESSREMAAALQTSSNPERVYRDKPIAAISRTLVRIGDHLERRVWVRDSLDLAN